MLRTRIRRSGCSSTEPIAALSSSAAVTRLASRKNSTRRNDTQMLPASDLSIGTSGRFPASVSSALRRFSSCGRRPTDTARRRRAAAWAWKTTASVMTRTRKPAACTRQQKSTSSRNRPMPVSKPRTRSHTSRRISMPALPTASVSRSPSCWPWSTSRGSIPVIRRPTVSMVSPASRMTSRSDQSMTLGPSTAAWGVSAAPRSSCSRASAAGSQSSCSSQIHSTRSSWPRADPRPDWPAGDGTGTATFAALCCSALATAAP